MVESAIVVSGNVGVDVFIQIDFILGDFADGLFLSQQVQHNQVGVVVARVGEGLSK